MTLLYFDVHIPASIATELRRRGVSVLTAQEDEAAELGDADLLAKATDPADWHSQVEQLPLR
jgi:hypothetical protein